MVKLSKTIRYVL